jgi:hypothetical protein
VWYNSCCLAYGNGAFLFLSADSFDNRIIVGKTPLISGLSSRRMLDTSATSERRFVMNDTKRCSTCEQYKPIDMFSKRSVAKDGLHYRCKECDSAHQKEYIEITLTPA